MNSCFNAQRFGHLLQCHWLEHWREYLWFIAIASIVDIIFILIALFSSGPSYSSFDFDFQMVWYTLGVMITGALFAGLYFKGLSQAGAALIYLMRPASAFEKWLLALLVCAVAFPLVYSIFFALFSVPAQLVAKALAAAMQCLGCNNRDFRLFLPFIVAEKPGGALDWSSEYTTTQVFVLIIFWTLQGMITSGYLLFKRSPGLKTIAILFLLLILITLFAQPEQGAVWNPSAERNPPYSLLDFALSLLLWTGLPVILWTAVYFLIKEREIA